MFGVTASFLSSLLNSHNVALRVDAYRSGVLIASDLPITGGSVEVDGTADIRRSLTLNVGDPTLVPKAGDATAVLSPYGTELLPYRGIQYPDGSFEWVPLGVYRVDEVDWNFGDATLSVKGSDRASRVRDARFTSPTGSSANLSVGAEIARLVAAAVPNLAVFDTTGNSQQCPAIVYDTERWKAVTELAAAIGCEVFFGNRGSLVIRPRPTIANDPVWQVYSGASGVMVSAETATDRTTTYNVIVASGERSDNTTPITATATDTDPASPTYVAGPYGSVPYFYTSPLLVSTAQAQAAADSLLTQTRSLVRQLTLSSVPNPALDAGDVIDVMLPDGTRERHIVDGLTIPLDVTSAMSIKTRTSNPTKE